MSLGGNPNCRWSLASWCATLCQFWPFPRTRSLGGERGKKRDSSVGITRFGAILKERDRSLRSGPVPSLPIRLSVSGRSQRGSVCARWSGRRRAWGGRIFSRWMLGDRFLGSQRVGRPVRIGARICCPDGGKTPRNGVEKATLGAICYVAHNGATPFEEYIYV